MMKPSKITIGRLGRPKLSPDGHSLVISIPICFRRQGGRKKVVTPSNVADWVSALSRVDSTVVKAVVRAHRWRNMLESNRFGTVRALAKVEKINESYLCRVLRLTLLSPALTEAILNGSQPDGLNLPRLLKSIPAEWDKQDAAFRP